MNKKKSPKMVPLKFTDTKDICSVYANGMVCQQMDGNVRISFFQHKIVEGLEKTIKEMKTNCVASVVVPADKVERFASLMLQYKK